MKKIFILLITVILCASGCVQTTPSATPLPSADELVMKPAEYNTFNGGLENFASNALTLGNFVIRIAEDTVDVESMSAEQKPLFDEMILQARFLELDMTSVSEIDTITASQESPDRANGNLPVTGYYGFKILQESRIKFGYDDTEADLKSMDGELVWKENYMRWQSTDKLNQNVHGLTIAEIVLTGERDIVLRYTKCVDNNGARTLKTIYIIFADNVAEIGYFAGKGDFDRFIALNKLNDYSLKAISFGVGTSMSMGFDLNN